MHGRRQNTGLRLCNMRAISNKFLWKFVQSKWKKQNSRADKAHKKKVKTLLNELFSLDDQVNNETKMEAYADEIDVKISV